MNRQAELESAFPKLLMALGWIKALGARRSLFAFKFLGKNGDFRFGSREAAKAAFSEAKARAGEFEAAIRGLINMSPEYQTEIEFRMKTHQELDGECPTPPRIDQAKLALEPVVYAALDYYNDFQAMYDAYWGKRGRPTNHEAYAVALLLAEFFVLQHGKRPTCCSSPIDAALPNTEYSRALVKAFKFLGIQSGFRSPGDAAVKSLTESRYRLLVVRGNGGPTTSLLAGGFSR